MDGPFRSLVWQHLLPPTTNRFFSPAGGNSPLLLDFCHCFCCKNEAPRIHRGGKENILSFFLLSLPFIVGLDIKCENHKKVKKMLVISEVSWRGRGSCDEGDTGECQVHPDFLVQRCWAVPQPSSWLLLPSPAAIFRLTWIFGQRRKYNAMAFLNGPWRITKDHDIFLNLCSCMITCPLSVWSWIPLQGAASKLWRTSENNLERILECVG